MAERADIFGEPDFDVSGFTPVKPAPAAAIRKVAEKATFFLRGA